MTKKEPLWRMLECGHVWRMDYPSTALILSGWIPCPACIDECEDRQHWMDERADDDEERALRPC